MTVIVNAFWGRRIIQVVDRQISRLNAKTGMTHVVDEDSTKVCAVLCRDALLSIAYTGVATANSTWMDSVIASCLAHRTLEEGFAQVGAWGLRRPAHVVINELALNLNDRLNSDPKARGIDMQVSIVGWHLARKQRQIPRPLSWEMKREPAEPNGMRYFSVKRGQVGKFLRQHPNGLWLESFGDPGSTVDGQLRALGETVGYAYDDIERHIVSSIAARAAETATVSAACLAVQLDPTDSDGHVQFTSYPKDSANSDVAPVLISGWLLTQRLISSPATETTLGSSFSTCGRYVVGGFSDGNTKLHVRTRLPANCVHHGGPAVLAIGTQSRPSAA